VDHYCVQQFAGKRNVFLLHDDERVENNVAKSTLATVRIGIMICPKRVTLPVPFITPVATMTR